MKASNYIVVREGRKFKVAKSVVGLDNTYEVIATGVSGHTAENIREAMAMAGGGEDMIRLMADDSHNMPSEQQRRRLEASRKY